MHGTSFALLQLQDPCATVIRPRVRYRWAGRRARGAWVGGMQACTARDVRFSQGLQGALVIKHPLHQVLGLGEFDARADCNSDIRRRCQAGSRFGLKS